MNASAREEYDVAIVGAGFTGLTAALELGRRGLKVCVVEASDRPGGLGGTFEFSDGVELEKFYHHWFQSDTHIPELAREISMDKDIVSLASRTGMYFNSRIWKLSTPLDLMRFGALSLVDRIRLGLLVLQVRRVRDWRQIEPLSVREWLEPLCGRNVYSTVWEPLIDSKFSVFAEDIGAVWMWKKLVLRGGSRDKFGDEKLAYFKGGFGRLAQGLVNAIEEQGGKVEFGTEVTGATSQGDSIASLTTANVQTIEARKFLFTPAFPIIADILEKDADDAWLASLRRIHYLGNICLVLRLKHSLSDTYWLNVNDPGFPFVGVIEHTNFDTPEHYRGSHIVYLSRYIARDDPVWSHDDETYLAYSLEHLRRMFPEFNDGWIIDWKIWRADHAQPVIERNYSSLVPDQETPFDNAWISTMAQIYPEDRGTNYAVREGRNVARAMLDAG